MELVGILSKGERSTFPAEFPEFPQDFGRDSIGKVAGKTGNPRKAGGKWLDFVAHPSRYVGALVSLLILPAEAAAQTLTGALVGTVKDARVASFPAP